MTPSIVMEYLYQMQIASVLRHPLIPYQMSGYYHKLAEGSADCTWLPDSYKHGAIRMS